MNESEPPTATERNGEQDDDRQIVVEDTDDYNQAQRLKEIHQARREVRKAQKELTRGKANRSEHKESHERFAATVAFYGHELLPLMEDTEWERELPEEAPYPSVRAFLKTAPMVPPGKKDEWPYIPEQVALGVFHHLNQFVREIGLGADFEDSADEWEV